MRLLALAVLGALAAAAPARAAEDPCNNGSFPNDQQAFGLARAVGKGRIPLLHDIDCRAQKTWCGEAVLASGATVITGRMRGRYVCVLEPKSYDAGWVPAARLAVQPVAVRPPLAAWRGWWRDGDDLILLDPRPGGELLVSGRAYWPMRHPPSDRFAGGAHFGQVNGQERPVGNRVDVEDGECTARLTLLGRYLVVGDNNRCGGMNVSFTAVYERQAPRAPRRPPR